MSVTVSEPKSQGPQVKRQVAVVTPLYRIPLAADEEISMRHLREYLGRFDRFLIGPSEVLGSERVAKGYADFTLRAFPERYFTGTQGYSQLLVMEEFYRAFAEYEFVLIYQLDCLVFSSNLEEWCRAGWDYIGAPWFNHYQENPTDGFWAVGNGGLSLRRVARALDVLTSKRLLDDPKVRGPQTERFHSVPQLRRVLVALRTLLLEHGYHNTVRWLVQDLGKYPNFHEDLFWAFHARRIVPDFNIATPQQALGFSFEMAPRYCFKANSERLPFGCHAWAKYDREFWKPFLLK
jgi:Protein of unknown function (DUF5672)